MDVVKNLLHLEADSELFAFPSAVRLLVALEGVWFLLRGVASLLASLTLSTSDILSTASGSIPDVGSPGK